MVKFNFLSRGQLESLSLVKFVLPVFKILPCHEVYLVTIFFAIIARRSRENRLNNTWGFNLINDSL